ncbi:HAD-like domain-containing protein [Cladochytrium replicatum]|nr:HAD-like domain-containing protein [Cladochytrium replicatum]
MTACLTDSGHVSPIKGVYSDNTTLLRSDLSAPFLPCDASSITLVDASCDPCFSTFESVTILENVAEQADTLNSSATTTSPESESTTAPKTPQQLQPYEFDPYAFIRTLPCIDDLPSRTRPFALPRKTRHSKKITLVLDLDETLVHCNTNEEGPLGMDLDDGLQFNVEVEGVTYHVNGKLRPHWKSFLRRVSEMFEVVVFTASQKVYADQLLNLLDPQHKWIKYRLYRESCILVNGNYLKDLTILGRDMTKVIIVDNSPQAFGYQVSNGIPITSFYDSQTDGELLSVLNFLEGIANVDDVRPHIDCAYGLKSLIWPDSVATAL